MIFCKLKGGLGNMLFQISATKSLSVDYNRPCYFSNLSENLQFLNDDNYYNPTLKNSFDYFCFLSNLKELKPNENIIKIDFPFEYKKINLPNQNVEIEGFFQSEKYFKHNRDEIIKFIKPDVSLFEEINLKYSFINKTKNTAIHVRRGDYLNFSTYFEILEMNYYNKGIKILDDITDNFLIFSNDIDWCKNNFKIKNAIFIGDEKDYISLFLMSLCDNFIIGNSSFSWWGAWLCEKENKKIIAPQKWFGKDMGFPSKDIIPENWIKI
jgi:hypothetical protein